MDKALFLSWLKEVFVPNCGEERPVLLLMDNHDSHISLELVQYARANQASTFYYYHITVLNNVVKYDL